MAYKARVLDCLTAEGRIFFAEEMRSTDSEASLRKIEYLIVDVIRPYKIGLYFLLAVALLLGGLLFQKRESALGEQLAAMKADNLKLREDLDNAVRKLARPAGATGPETIEAKVDMDQMASRDPEQFYHQLADQAEKKRIPKAEVARLIKVGAARDPFYALLRVRAKPALTSALSAAELTELVRKGTRE